MKGKKINSTNVPKIILVDHIINIENSDNIFLIKILNMVNMSHCGIASQINIIVEMSQC